MSDTDILLVTEPDTWGEQKRRWVIFKGIFPTSCVWAVSRMMALVRNAFCCQLKPEVFGLFLM